MSYEAVQTAGDAGIHATHFSRFRRQHLNCATRRFALAFLREFHASSLRDFLKADKRSC
jgi:hypothetical protein